MYINNVGWKWVFFTLFGLKRVSIGEQRVVTPRHHNMRTHSKLKRTSSVSSSVCSVLPPELNTLIVCFIDKNGEQISRTFQIQYYNRCSTSSSLLQPGSFIV